MITAVDWTENIVYKEKWIQEIQAVGNFNIHDFKPLKHKIKQNTRKNLPKESPKCKYLNGAKR